MPPLILIGLGANLDSPVWGSPRQTLTAALAALEAADVVTRARSGWYRSAPVPPSEQPWFINAVVSVSTLLGACGLLALMQKTEIAFGRVRAERNSARVLDLDLLDYHGRRIQTPELILPHPRIHQRRFVLEPLVELVPQWRHPILGQTAEQLLAALDRQQPIERLSC